MDLNVNGHHTVAATGTLPFDAGKPTLVFIHGAGMDRTVWALQSRHPAFSAWNVLAIDLPGHGLSHGAAKSDIEALADWLLLFLDKAGIEKAVAIGHSMGALVALEAASRAPERITGLVLLGVTHPMPVAPSLLEVAKANDIAAVRMIIGWAFTSGSDLKGGPAPGLRMTGASSTLLANAGPGVLYADLKACNAYTAGLERAKALRCPVLYVVGGQDRMARPKGAMALADVTPDATIVTIAQAGHMMMSETSAEVIAALKSFLVELDF